mgnify:CR=1 FL=1
MTQYEDGYWNGVTQFRVFFYCVGVGCPIFLFSIGYFLIIFGSQWFFVYFSCKITGKYSFFFSVFRHVAPKDVLIWMFDKKTLWPSLISKRNWGMIPKKLTIIIKTRLQYLIVITVFIQCEEWMPRYLYYIKYNIIF